MTRPPRYSHKADRLIVPGASPTEIRCDFACAPLDRAVRASDDRWGTDRLVGLATPETAERYGRAIVALMASYESNQPN